MPANRQAENDGFTLVTSKRTLRALRKGNTAKPGKVVQLDTTSTAAEKVNEPSTPTAKSHRRGKLKNVEISMDEAVDSLEAKVDSAR